MADGSNVRFNVVKLFIAVQPLSSLDFHVEHARLFIALRQISACRAWLYFFTSSLSAGSGCALMKTSRPQQLSLVATPLVNETRGKTETKTKHKMQIKYTLPKQSSGGGSAIQGEFYGSPYLVATHYEQPKVLSMRRKQVHKLRGRKDEKLVLSKYVFVCVCMCVCVCVCAHIFGAPLSHLL